MKTWSWETSGQLWGSWGRGYRYLLGCLPGSFGQGWVHDCAQERNASEKGFSQGILGHLLGFWMYGGSEDKDPDDS